MLGGADLHAGAKRKAEQDLQQQQRDGNGSKRLTGAAFESLVSDLRILLEAKCRPIAERCVAEGVLEMVRRGGATRACAPHAWPG